MVISIEVAFPSTERLPLQAGSIAAHRRSVVHETIEVRRVG